MGNVCTGESYSKNVVNVFWWSRADRAIACDDKEFCSRKLDVQPEVHMKPPERVIIVQEKTKRTGIQEHLEGVKAVELRHQEFKEDIRPIAQREEVRAVESKPRELKEVIIWTGLQPWKFQEETSAPRQTGHVEETRPIQSRRHEDEFVSRNEQPVGNEVVIQPTKQVIGKNPRNVKGIKSVGLHMDSVLQTHKGYFKEFYRLGDEIGHGRYGTTFLCIEKSTGKEFACKCIPKGKLKTLEDVKDMRREIQIMHHLAGHPNIIEIKGAYEDPITVFVVMELCTGGELFDRIINRGHYTEKKAAELARTILSVVAYCHSLGVFHRDLKPENFLLVNREENSPIKMIDFGLSEFFKQGDTFSDVAGSPFYVAPEVLRRCYGPKADVWSAGVIIYILICGEPPFWGENDDDLFQEVLTGRLDFLSDPWPEVSESAKDLLRKMLERDPRKRISAQEALCHPWVQLDGVAQDKPLDSAVLSRLKKFSAMTKLKKMALRVIAERLSKEEIAGLKKMFKSIDTDNSGQITFEELKVGLKRYGATLSETEIHELLKAADLDNNGTIDYGEFIAATLNFHKVERDDHLFAAFSYFDKDGSGYITQDELQQACEELGVEDAHLEEMIQEVDQDNDGRIDYKEFVTMMQKESAELGKKGHKSSFSFGFREVAPVF